MSKEQLIAELKAHLDGADVDNKIDSQYRTNYAYYLNILLKFIEENPTQLYLSQYTLKNEIFEGEDLAIINAACLSLRKDEDDYNLLFMPYYEHFTYDDRNNELSHELTEEEFFKALNDPNYVPIDNETGFPVEFYNHKWLTMYINVAPNTNVVFEDINF